MKFRFLHKFKRRFFIILAILCAAFIINSCRKDGKSTQQESSAISISQAKTWYENAYPVTGSAGSKLITQSIGGIGGGTPDLSQIMQPDWQNAAVYARLGSNVIEMPIAAGANFGYDFNNKTANKIYSDKTYNRAYFLLLNDGKSYQAYVMMIMADPAYVNNDLTKLSHNSYRKHDPDFTGMVAYFTPKGQYVSGAAFVNGQLVTAAADAPSAGGQAVQSIRPRNAKPVANTTAPVTQCTDWYADYYIDGVFWYSQFLGTTCTTSTGTNSPAPGGGGPPPPPPCQTSGPGGAVEAVGHLTIDVTEPLPTPPGGGGMPAPAPCPVIPVPVIDTVKDPCALLKHLDSLLQDPNVSKANVLVRNEIGTQHEYATDVYFTTFPPSGPYSISPLITDFNNTSITANFSWDPGNYTIDIVHDHPFGDGPSPNDIFRLYVNSNNANLDNAGQAQLNYYMNNAVITTITSSTTYIVSGTNYTTLGHLYQQYKADTAAFNTKYRDLTDQFSGHWDQALLTIFGSSINLFESYNNRPPYSLIQLIDNQLTANNCP